MPEESKHDIMLKRMNITIAILAGIATLLVGIYNVKKVYFSKPEPEPESKIIRERIIEAPPQAPVASPIRQALEESGASWIRNISKKYVEPKEERLADQS